LPGKPDIVFRGARLAVFVDGAFWHGHPSKLRPGRYGAYWDAKIESNILRARRVETELARGGWTFIRFWDFEVESDAEGCARTIERLLEPPSAGGGERHHNE
jgi:DNA mismatch endonuclease, patch repair protein